MDVNVACQGLGLDDKVFVEVVMPKFYGENFMSKPFWEELCANINAHAETMGGLMQAVTVKCLKRDEGGIEVLAKKNWLSFPALAERVDTKDPRRLRRAEIRADIQFRAGNAIVLRFWATEDCPLVAMMVLVHILAMDPSNYVSRTEGIPHWRDESWKIVETLGVRW
jgi:hypothetical protein